MSDKDQCRSQFEAWAGSLKLNLECVPYQGGTHYISPTISAAWTSWQAAWAHLSAAKDTEIARLRSALEDIEGTYRSNEAIGGSKEYVMLKIAQAALSQPSAQEGK